MVKIFDLKSARGLLNLLETSIVIVQRQTNYFSFLDLFISIKSHYLELKLSQDVIQSFNAY